MSLENKKKSIDESTDGESNPFSRQGSILNLRRQGSKITQSDVLKNLLAVNKNLSGEDDTIITMSLGQNQASIENANNIMFHGGKNLDQYFVDNPPMKQHGTTMITD